MGQRFIYCTKTRKMNSRSLPDIVRIGVVVLISPMGLVLLTEAANSTRSYSLSPKPHTKPTEIRGLKIKPRTKPTEIRGLKIKPHILSTAIGFGKRVGSFPLANQDRQRSTLTSLQKATPQRFSLFWYLQYLKSNPELANNIARKYLANDGDDDYEAILSITRR